VADETLLLQLGERPERLGERPRLGRVEAADAQVDDVEGVQAQSPQVVVHLGAQLLGLARAANRPARRDARRPW